MPTTQKKTPNIKLQEAIYSSGKRTFEIANEVGMTPYRFAYIARGIYPVREHEKKPIAKALGKKVSDLFDAAAV